MSDGTALVRAASMLAPLTAGKRLPAWSAAPGRRLCAPASLATIALGIWTLVANVTADPPQSRGLAEPLALLAGLRAPPPATAPAPGAASGVAFLWEADGHPGFPLDRPTGAALDPQGHLWITDGANDRFVIFSPDGVALEAWGTSGSGEGEFDFACRGIRYGGVAFDAAGNIYVADAGNQRIQKFGPDRTLLTSWPSTGLDANPLLVTGRQNQGVVEDPPRCPVALAVAGQGQVVVSDRNARAIAIYDADGHPLVTGTTASMLPHGVALDRAGAIWVADTANRVLQFSPRGQLLTTWARYGSGSGQLNAPMGLAVDAQGRVFVTDHSNRVQVFAPDGQFLGAWGSHGSAEAPFADPRAVVLDGLGHVYVIEHYGSRVQKFRLAPPFGPA
jgi:DNA-binding beta-propeller fold protein YncE